MALALTPWLWALAARPRLFMLEPFSLQIMRSSAPPGVPGRPADADGRPVGVGLISTILRDAWPGVNTGDVVQVFTYQLHCAVNRGKGLGPSGRAKRP